MELTDVVSDDFEECFSGIFLKAFVSGVPVVVRAFEGAKDAFNGLAHSTVAPVESLIASLFVGRMVFGVDASQNAWAYILGTDKVA